MSAALDLVAAVAVSVAAFVVVAVAVRASPTDVRQQIWHLYVFRSFT